MTIQRIAYLGNHRHPWCTEVHLSATLERLGYDVDRIQEDDTPLVEIETRALACDLVIYTRTPPGLPNRPIDGHQTSDQVIAMWRRLEAAGVRTASYHLDLYYGIPRGGEIHHDPFWRTEFVFTPDGDPAAAAWFAEHGINHHWIRPGVYRPEATPGRANPARFPHPIVFVGSTRSYHREWPWRQQLVDHLRTQWGQHAGIYGSEELGLVRGMPLNDLYATATVVVGDTLCPGFDKPNYWSDRVYETVGRGGYLLHPWIKGLDDEFVAGEHLDYYTYGDLASLDQLITHALDDPDRARRVATAGQAMVRSKATYDQRLAQAISIIEGTTP